MTRLAPSHSHIHYESCTTGGIITSEKQISIKSCAFHRQFPGMRGSRARFHFHLFFFCKICFNFLKFMRFLLKQWQRWWYGLRPRFSPLLSVWVWYDINESPDRLYALYTIYVCAYSQPINVYFEYSFSVLLWFICSCSCPQVAPPVRCSSGGLYDL